MAITCFFGKTESGKSFLAGIKSKEYERVVIYDNAHCFTDGVIITDLSVDNLKRVFKKYHKEQKFRIIFRAPYSMNEQTGANRVASFVWALGSFYKDLEKKARKKVKRFLFLVDEADKVSSYAKDNVFYRCVTKGRHFNFDSYGIAQGATKLPNYWRENASEFCIFKLPESTELKTLLRNGVGELRNLEQYSYLRVKDNSNEVEVVSKSQNVIKKIEM